MRNQAQSGSENCPRLHSHQTAGLVLNLEAKHLHAAFSWMQIECWWEQMEAERARALLHPHDLHHHACLPTYTIEVIPKDAQ